MNDSERFGKDMADFLRGLLGAVANERNLDTTTTGKAPWEPEKPQERRDPEPWPHSSPGPKGFPADFELWADYNSAKPLKPGNLLITHLSTNRCFQVDVETGEATFLFSLNWGPRTFFWRAIADTDGSIYCTVSGTLASTKGQIPPGYRAPAAKFDYWGAVVKVSYREEKLQVLAETDTPGVGDVLDPHGLQLIGDDLLVCDYQGFGGGGAVYSIPKAGGAPRLIRKGGLLSDTPVNAYIDEANILWVTNSYMDENDGEIIRIDLSSKRDGVFVPKRGKGSGCCVGLIPSNEPDELILFRCEWPNVGGKSCVSIVNKKTAKVTDIFRSSIDNPIFPNTSGIVVGNTLWFGECVQKELLAMDLKTRKIIKRFDLKAISGGYAGMVDSYDAIEAVSVIPELKTS